MKKQKIYYYENLSDEVLDDNVNPPIIDEKYVYVSKNPFYKFFTAIYYRCIIFPIAWIYCKLIKRIKYVNKKVLKKAKKTGYFVYGNHTHNISDAFSPSVISACKKPYVVISPKNFCMPVLGKTLKMLGALPIPSGLRATKNFMSAMEYRLSKKHGIVIYPEAKVWPYYTQIRPFATTSFKYPIAYNVPSFCYTMTYQKTKRGKCKMVMYIDGPFYPNPELSSKQQQQDLHDKIYDVMLERSKNSNFETCEYIQGEQN